jgi:hypothetical protein
MIDFRRGEREPLNINIPSFTKEQKDADLVKFRAGERIKS